MSNYIKQGSSWKRSTAKPKVSSSYKENDPFVKNMDVWKGLMELPDENSFTFEILPGAALQLDFMGITTTGATLEQISGPGVMTYSLSSIYLIINALTGTTPYVLKFRGFKPGGSTGSMVFAANSRITRLVETKFRDLPFYPVMNSSVLTAVPDKLPPSIKSLKDALYGCSAFNQPLNWDTKNVTSFQSFMRGCSSFNQPMNLDLSSATNISYFMLGCSSFNHPLNFSAPLATQAAGAFGGCSKLNEEVNIGIRSASSLEYILSGCTVLNKPITIRADAAVNADLAFQDCKALNSPIVLTNAKIKSFYYSLIGCSSFNQQLDWDVSKATSLYGTLYGCTVFAQNLNHWDVRHNPAHDIFSYGTAMTPAMLPLWGKDPIPK